MVQKYDTLGLELSGGLEYEKMRWQVYAVVERRYGHVPARTLFTMSLLIGDEAVLSSPFDLRTPVNWLRGSIPQIRPH